MKGLGPPSKNDIVIEDLELTRDNSIASSSYNTREALMNSAPFQVIPSLDKKLKFQDVRSQVEYLKKVKTTLGYPRDVDTVTHEERLDSTVVFSCLVTTFCFFPLGMPALLMAIDARAAMARGDPMFYKRMRKAGNLANIGLALGLTAWGLGIIGILFKYVLYTNNDTAQ